MPHKIKRFKRTTLIAVVAWHLLPTLAGADQPWKRHVIDNSHHGADGVRLADFNSDGHADIVTGWEESGIVKLYLNPGPAKSKDLWPQVTIGVGQSPEDAVPFDVDNDGALEVISCHEGKTKQVLVHKFIRENKPVDSLVKSELLKRANWKTTPIPTLDGQMWMFAAPITLRNGQRGLVLGSKGKNATLTLLLPPTTGETEIEKWLPFKIIAGVVRLRLATKTTGR